MTGILSGLIGSIVSGFRNIWNTGNAANSLTHVSAEYAPLANGRFFGFGAANTSITTATNLYNYSTNGVSWSSGTLPASIQSRASAANSSRIVVASNTTTNYYSNNGTTWTAGGSMGGGIKTEGLWDGSRFVFCSSTASVGIAHSTDGTSWTIYSNAGANAIGFDRVNTYITVGGSSTARINTTDITSSAAWSNITLPSLQAWSSIKHNGQIWVAAVGNQTTYATSTNGTTWTQRTLPATMGGSGTAVRPKMAVFNQKFYYLSYSSPNARIYSSSDGINWTLETTVSTALVTAQGWAVGPTSLIAFGMSSTTVGTAAYVRGE